MFSPCTNIQWLMIGISPNQLFTITSMFATKYTSWCFFCKSFEENQPFLETVGLWWCVSFDFGYMVRGEIIINESPENQSLGRGFKYFFIFTLKIGEDEPILANIFQMGWLKPPARSLTAAGCADRDEVMGCSQRKPAKNETCFGSFLFFFGTSKKIPKCGEDLES